MTHTNPPERIGPYRILESLGRGAWGHVYLAEQGEPVRRQVALKVALQGADSREVLARFEVERQAMALMNHPGIVKILDAGSTEHDVPYFVMEFVNGLPLIQYCDTRGMTIRQRLELFREICLAVHHAHQRGIIHRDLKPSNILVAEENGRAQPKVIDFGIAKALYRPLTDKTLHTQQGALLGTPHYMSPEQAAGAQDVDTTADVYSLGVLLYELLSGTLPWNLDSLELEELLRVLREGDVPSLQSRFVSMGSARGEIADERKTDVQTLSRRLGGELDWIVQRSLEKDRTRRYASASELAAEIRRYLDDEPVLAGPPSLAYRLGKTIRRHRLAFASIVLIATLSLVFAVAMGIQARRVTAEAERANREAATARVVSDFMVTLFEVNDPFRAQGEEITVRELLDRGITKANEELEDQPRIRSQMLHTFGRVLLSLGHYDQAAEQLEAALSLRELRSETHPLELAESLHVLASVYSRQSRFSEARAAFERALTLREQELGASHADVARTFQELAEVFRREGRYEEGKALAVRALEIQEVAFGPEDQELLRALNLVAVLELSLGNYDPALTSLQRGLSIIERSETPDELMRAYLLANLGLIESNNGNYVEAEAFYRRALVIKEKILEPDHPSLPSTLNILAGAIRSQGRLGEAQALYQRAMRILETRLGPESPELAVTLSNLAGVLVGQDKGSEAEPLYLRSLEVQRRAYGDQHPNVGLSTSNLGLVYGRRGDYERAEPLLRDALEILEKSLGPTHSSVANTLGNLAGTYAAMGRDEEAEEGYRRALAVANEAVGPDHPMVARLSAEYAAFLRENHRPEEADLVEAGTPVGPEGG